MRFHLNRVHFPVTALGYGARIGVWFQGCSIRCPGCVSRDTWDAESGQVDFEQFKSAIQLWAQAADGLTVSGGEPFDQPEALAALVEWYRSHFSGDILVYSGYAAEVLWQNHAHVLHQVDALISDPYDAQQSQTRPLRGSDNQRLHLLSTLAQERYATLDQDPALDVCFDGQTVWLAGIPKPNHMSAIRQRLHQLGFSSSTSNQIVDGVRA